MSPRRRFSARGRITIAVVATIVVATGCGTARSGTSSTPSRSAEAAIERLIRDHSTANDVGMIALVEADGQVWRFTAGLDARDRPVEPDARFDMGSTSKVYEAVVVLQLVEEGRLSLDDRVQELLPGQIKGAHAHEVLVRHLLNHTSTLEGERAPWHTTGVPGTEFSYSNLGYGLLWEIVTDITGHSLPEEINDRVLEPLGLEDRLSSSGLPWLGAPYGTCGICLDPRTTGGGIATTSDVARFLHALVGGELLGEDTLAVMMEEAVPSVTEQSVGHGLFRFDLPCGVAYGHGGDLPYYANHVLVSADGSKVVVLAQARGGWYPIKVLAEEIYCRAA